MNYKSTEERVFAAWLAEAFVRGIVTYSKYEPETFLLAEPVQRTNKKGKLVQHWAGLEYTPDWYVQFSENVFDVPEVNERVIKTASYKLDCYFEIKGTYTKFVQRDLPIRLGLMIQKHSIFVKLLKIPDDLPWIPVRLPDECYNKNGTIAAKWKR